MLRAVLQITLHTNDYVMLPWVIANPNRTYSTAEAACSKHLTGETEHESQQELQCVCQ